MGSSTPIHVKNGSKRQPKSFVSKGEYKSRPTESYRAPERSPASQFEPRLKMPARDFFVKPKYSYKNLHDYDLFWMTNPKSYKPQEAFSPVKK